MFKKLLKIRVQYEFCLLSKNVLHFSYWSLTEYVTENVFLTIFSVLFFSFEGSILDARATVKLFIDVMSVTHNFELVKERFRVNCISRGACTIT